MGIVRFLTTPVPVENTIFEHPKSTFKIIKKDGVASGKRKCMKEIASNHLHIRLTKIKNTEDGFLVTIQCMPKNSNVFQFKVIANSGIQGLVPVLSLWSRIHSEPRDIIFDYRNGTSRCQSTKWR